MNNQMVESSTLAPVDGFIEYHKNGSLYWSTRTHWNDRQTVTSYRGPKRYDKTMGRKAFLIPNDFSLSKKSTTLSEGSARWSNGTSDWYMASNYFIATNPLENLKPVLLDGPELVEAGKYLAQAQTDAWAQANSPDFSGLTELGELKETLGFLKSVGWDLFKVLKSYIRDRNKLKRKLRRLKADPDELKDAIASLWLQYRYAIMPLVLSTNDLVSLLVKQTTLWEKFSGYVKRTEVVSQTPGGIPLYYLQISWTWEETLTYTGGVGLFPVWHGPPKIDWGVDAYDVITTAWELTTLSFVVDWFIGIGSFLQAYRPSDADIRYQSNTVLARRELIVKDMSFQGTYGYSITELNPPGEIKTQAVGLVRTNRVEKPTLPVFNKEVLSVMHKADALALVWGMYRTVLKKML